MAVNAWSFSVLDSFETCAWKHYQTKVAKAVVESQSKEMLWGNQVHKGLELRVKDGTPLPEGMQQWEPIAHGVDEKRRQGATVTAEQKLAIDNQFRPVSYFAKDGNKQNMVWCRGQADLTIERRDKANIWDWKTGKPKPSSDQMKLMAGLSFIQKPYLNHITTAFVFLKYPKADGSPTILVERFAREDVAGIWQDFLPRVQRLDHALAENKWPKKPSGLCKNYCPLPRSMCEHRS